MSDQALAEGALDALGDAQRRAIVRALGRGPTPVGALADQLPIGRPAVSKHLKVLEGAGLVRHTSVGTRNLYELAPEALVPLQQWLVQTWDRTLAAYADHVRARRGERPNDQSDPADGREAG